MSLEKGTPKLSSAPLVYVLAQVRHSPVLSIDKYIPAIQEQARGDYPRFQKRVIQTLSVGTNGQSPELTAVHRWEFSNKSANTGFILQADSFVFHTTAYETFKEFISGIRSSLNIVQSVLNFSLVERIGLRYIDVIEVDGDEKLHYYFIPGLAGFPHEQLGTEPVINKTESVTMTEYGHLVLRATKKKNVEMLPPDLSSHGLTITREIQSVNPTAILDFDHYSEHSIDYSTDDVIDCLERLHGITSKAFWATISDYAINKWS